MKILVISATFPPMRSGGADFALALCQRVADAGNEVTVLTSQIPNVVTDPRLRILPQMTRWAWRDLRPLLKVAKEVRPDVINLHFHGEIYNHHPMITLAPSLLKRALPGVRVVTHIEWPMPILRERSPRITRLSRKVVSLYAGATGTSYGYGSILSDSDRLIVLSETHRQPLINEDARATDKFVFIPPAATLPPHPESVAEARQRGREALGVAADTFLLAYFGYIYPFKGLETLLLTVALLARNHPQVRLVLIGGDNEVLLKTLNRPKYNEELRELAKDMGIADRLIWTGYIPSNSADASRYLRAADAAALLFDSGAYMNNSSLGAVTAHGLPTITTRAPVVESPLRHGENVLLCPTRDADCAAAAVDSLIGSRELCERLGRGALELWREWFSWERLLPRTMEAYAGGTNGRAAGS
jgi:glycosyltransferase involved in cell wall biosynthesis